MAAITAAMALTIGVKLISLAKQALEESREITPEEWAEISSTMASKNDEIQRLVAEQTREPE